MFENLSNLEFLLKQESRICASVIAFHKKYRKFSNDVYSINDQEELNRLIRLRDSAHRNYKNCQLSLKINRNQIAIRSFQDSKYGIRINRYDGRHYTTIEKSSREGRIQSWLFDHVDQDPEKISGKLYQALTAREFIEIFNNSDLHSTEQEKATELLNLAKLEIRTELDKHLGFSNWETPTGLAAYNPKMLWLFAGQSKLIKIKGVINKDNYSLNTKTWKNVTYQVNNDYEYNSHPKQWILGSNGIIYPIRYARKKNISVSLLACESYAYQPQGKINSLTLVFSHRFGYYNASVYKKYDGKLCKISDFVTLYNGESCHLSSARFIERYQAYYNQGSCVTLDDGTFELSRECFEINGVLLHNSSPDLLTCGLCGGTHHVNDFVVMDSTDPESPKACNNCIGGIHERLQRMCYSTDVLNHKGYGNTHMKISGKPVYVGLELETYADYNNEKNGVILAINKFAAGKQNYCVATQDGSLDRHHGVEYIFRPEGIIHQKRNVNDFCSSVGQYLAKDAGDGYGLHVHVSNHFLTNMDKIRIDNFVSIFDVYFRHFGSRAQTEYQIKKDIRSVKSLKNKDNSKYKMVNIAPNATIEFRFPKSIVDEVHINMNLELALATTMFCKYHLSNASLNVKKLKTKPLQDFIDYVAKNKKTYPLLNAENNANIKLNKLEKYSKWCKVEEKEISSYSSTENVDYCLAV